MKKNYAMLCLGAAIMLTACSPKGNESIDGTPSSTGSGTETESRPVDTTVTEQIFGRESSSPATHQTVVRQYDLGERTYTAQSGKTMPYKIRGVAGVPEEEGMYPLVLITHGSHSNEDDSKRFDTGFTYLVEALAKRGYVAVSMDMSSPYLWQYGDGDDREKSIAVADEQIRMLKSCSQGKVEFPVDLQGKIDWEQVNLIGHSRGGDTIFDIAVNQQKEGVAIASLLSIAPAMAADMETRKLPDVPTAILVPEYDGDVVSLDGFAIQSVLADASQSPNTVTMLKRANHNYFNTDLTTNDALLARSEEQLTDQLEAAAQQEFLAAYTLDFLEGTLLDKHEMQMNRMYGQDVINRTSFGTDETLVLAEIPEVFASEGTTVTPVVDAWFYESDQVPADTITFGEDKKKEKQLLDIQWQGQGGRISFTPEKTDFSSHTMLTLYMLPDPANEKNQKQDYQRMSVTLEDERGVKSTVTLGDKRNSLKVPAGKLDATPIFDKEIQFWSVPTPIAATSIPLESFAGVNLGTVKTITLSMDQTEEGAVYLEKITVQ